MILLHLLTSTKTCSSLISLSLCKLIFSIFGVNLLTKHLTPLFDSEVQVRLSSFRLTQLWTMSWTDWDTSWMLNRFNTWGIQWKKMLEKDIFEMEIRGDGSYLILGAQFITEPQFLGWNIRCALDSVVPGDRGQLQIASKASFWIIHVAGGL